MIALISATPHWGDIAMLGLMIVGLVLLARATWVALDLWVDHLRDHGSIEDVADSVGYSRSEVDTATQHAWDAGYRQGREDVLYPDLDEDVVEEESTGQHARVDEQSEVETTTVMSVVVSGDLSGAEAER